LVDQMRQDMEQASEEMRFEAAALIRDRIQALERLMNRQKAVTNRPEDRDVLGLAGNGSEFCLKKMEIRQGRLVGAATFFWADTGQQPAELLSAFIVQHYPDAAVIPPEIFVPEVLPDEDMLHEFLHRLRNGRIQLRTPSRGSSRELLTMAKTNAEEALHRHTLMGGSGQTAQQEALQYLADLVGLHQAPHRIEAIDISNTSGQDQAASLIVFVDGKPARQQYRQFRLDDLEGADDYEAMRVTLRRRLRHLDELSFGSRPDLILADGGRGHVAALLQVMAEMDLSIPVAGMVKDDRHRTRGLVTAAGEVVNLRPENTARIQVDGEFVMQVADDADGEGQEGLLPARRLVLLRLLTGIQDEAHRFANRYRSKLAQKRQTRFSLEDIRGIGPARRKLLLQHFQTLRRIADASLDELKAAPGLGDAAAQAVYTHFHKEEES
jgi:excinuclease ABC subunit C